jgi:pimeloyl-ACP methyl ester carboxylesterase
MTAAIRGIGAREHVLLVHGLLRSPRSFAFVRRALEKAGFAASGFGYPSTRGTFDRHGDSLAAELARLDADPAVARLHLVGHSLGNLVIRAALARPRPGKLGRVVMLVPPNRGSPVARRLARRLGDLFPVLHDLSDEPGSAARRLPPLAGVPFGVIAARFDHVVRRVSTHLPGESGHLLLATTHSFLLLRPSVHRQIVRFLRDGRFEPVGARPG